MAAVCLPLSPPALALSGADSIKKYWSRYYQGSQGVVFVLDSAASEDDMEGARTELHSALHHPQLCTLPFLILANHQDKPAARPVREVTPAPTRVHACTHTHTHTTTSCALVQPQSGSVS